MKIYTTNKKGLRVFAVPVIAAACVLSLTACSEPQSSVDVEAVEAAAHGGYVDAINSNDIETMLASLTDDVVYQYPNGPEMIGKDAVRAWGTGYYDAYTTKWEKTSHGFTVSGDWAFERYTYKSTDTDKATGEILKDEGKGINIFQRGTDGKWRVAVDGWSTSLPAAGTDNSAADIVGTVYKGFAAGDMNMVTSVMSPDIIWNEAEGNPYADLNPYVGPNAVLSGVFARIGGQWTGFTATPSEFVTEGNRVVVFGRYKGNYTATGKTLDAQFVHSWTLTDGQVTGFQQYMDTEQQVAVMTK